MISILQTSPNSFFLQAPLSLSVPGGAQYRASTVVAQVLYVKFLPIVTLFGDSSVPIIPPFYLRTMFKFTKALGVPSMFNPIFQLGKSDSFITQSIYPGDTDVSSVLVYPFANMPSFEPEYVSLGSTLYFFIETDPGDIASGMHSIPVVAS